MSLLFGIGLIFVSVGAGAWSTLLANELNRAAHRRLRRPGTAFEPDVDPTEEGDQEKFEQGLKVLESSPSLPVHIRRQLLLYRGLQIVACAAGVGAALAVWRP